MFVNKDIWHVDDIGKIHELITELTLMNEQHAVVATRLRVVIPAISRTVNEIALRLKRGGRLGYVGIGSSGGRAWSVVCCGMLSDMSSVRRDSSR